MGKVGPGARLALGTSSTLGQVQPWGKLGPLEMLGLGEKFGPEKKFGLGASLALRKRSALEASLVLGASSALRTISAPKFFFCKLGPGRAMSALREQVGKKSFF